MSENLPKTKYLDPEVLQQLGDLERVAREVVEGLRVGSHRTPHPVNLTDRRRSVFLTNNNQPLGQVWCQSFRT